MFSREVEAPFYSLNNKVGKTALFSCLVGYFGKQHKVIALMYLKTSHEN